MAVYKIALRVNGADVPTPPAPTNSVSPEQNIEETKGKNKNINSKQLPVANPPNSNTKSSSSTKSSSAAHTINNMAKSSIQRQQPFSPQYQQQLYRKTVNLIITRTVLNRKLSRAFSRKDRFSHKLLDRHYRLKHQERKHLAARTRLLAELQKEYKLNPSAERAKDVRLVRKLLRSFKNHLKSDQYAHKYRSFRPSPSRSLSASPSSSDMDDHEPGVTNPVITVTTEKLDSELLMTTANGSLRKRRASERSNASLTALFTQEHSEKSDGDNGALVVPKKTKKLKLDLSGNEKPGDDTTVAPAPVTPTTAVADEGESKADASTDDKQKVDSEESQQPPAAAKPLPSKPVTSIKEDKADDTLAAPSPKTPVYPSKERRGSIDTTASASPSSKKHTIEPDESKSPKTKKAKVEAGAATITPAVPATIRSPKKPAKTLAEAAGLAPSKKYHEQAVYEMLNDPLGFDDLVYDDTRPMHKRPKFGRLGFRYKKPPPNFSPMMSGGIGKDLPDDTTQKKRKEKGHKREGSLSQLSQQVLKKNHQEKISQKVQESKAAAAAGKNKSVLNGLTEKSKYSVSKEARYGSNPNKNAHAQNHNKNNAGSVQKKNNTKGFNNKGGNKTTNISSARRQLHAVRSQYSLFT